jgi:phosphatidylserine decarboxylase
MRIAKAGRPFILGCFFTATAVWILGGVVQGPISVVLRTLAGIPFLGGFFCAYFFRDPPRVIPAGDHLILSPADGKVTEVIEVTDPLYNEPVWVLRIFLSVFDPHIQRTPVAGKVQGIRYTAGCFLDARHPKACFDNEQNRIEISPVGRLAAAPLVVTQIAGLIARRIVCWVNEGQSLAAGEQIGLIRFGSQVNLVMPKSVRLKVKAGDRVEAGATVVAEAGQ